VKQAKLHFKIYIMKNILLFGASGNLGKEIAKEVVKQGYDLTVVVRNKAKADSLSSITKNSIVADVTNSKALENVCNGSDAVISALGKSVSMNDKSNTTFQQIDLDANSNILAEAKKSGVKKFVYVSALHSENYLYLDYFKVHHAFSERLKASGINYSIIKPPAIMCAFKDVIEMARKNQLMNIGSGDKRTNPIYEGDLAVVCVNSLKEINTTVEAGGENVYTRKQLNEIIQNAVKPGKRLVSIPSFMVRMGLPAMKLFNKNAYDKFAFYMAVMQHDTLAPKVGKMKFEDYIRMRLESSN
jgi:uncharacterized protein YbjT (DUF2867 family)